MVVPTRKLHTSKAVNSYLPQALIAISQAPTIHFDTLANFDNEQASQCYNCFRRFAVEFICNKVLQLIGSSTCKLDIAVRDKSHVSCGSNQEAPYLESCKYLPQALK